MEKTLEDLQTRHRKEQRDLQARITQKKKAATKKTRKGVNGECEALEHQLREKQAHEFTLVAGTIVSDADHMSELDDEEATIMSGGGDGDGSRGGEDPVATEGTSTLPGGKTPSSEELAVTGQPRKRNRARERLARRAAEQEAAVAAAREEAANQPSQKDIEHEAIIEAIEARGLIEKSIRPDGHCLFSAVADQLSELGISIGDESTGSIKGDQRYTLVRKVAATYIEDHPDDFAAWLEEPLPDYVNKIRDTAEWGGHLELLALAKAYNVEICVIQNGAPERIKPDSDAVEPKTIWLAYYRHGYGLGEHYNSLRKAP